MKSIQQVVDKRAIECIGIEPDDVRTNLVALYEIWPRSAYKRGIEAMMTRHRKQLKYWRDHGFRQEESLEPSIGMTGVQV